MLTAKVAARLIGLFTVLYMIRRLGTDNYGVFSALINLTAIASVALDLGFNVLFVREGARHHDQIQRYLRNVMSVRLLMSVVALLLLAALVYPIGLGDLIVPGFVLMVLTSYSTLLRNGLYAVQQLGFEAIAVVLESGVLLALVLYGGITHQGVAYFVWAYAGQYAFSCLYFTGRVDASVYAAAYKPIEALLFVPITFLSIVFPVLAVYHRERPKEMLDALNRFYKALLLMGWPASVGIFVLAQPLTPLLLGSQFGASEAPLKILALALGLAFINNVFIGALNASDRQVSFTWAAAWSVVANLALNFALIPPWSYIGASWATVGTELVLGIAGWVLTARHVGRVPVLTLGWRVILAGLIMGVAIYPLSAVRGFEVAIPIAAGAIIYAVAVLLLRALSGEEIAWARRALALAR